MFSCFYVCIYGCGSILTIAKLGRWLWSSQQLHICLFGRCSQAEDTGAWTILKIFSGVFEVTSKVTSKVTSDVGTTITVALGIERLIPHAEPECVELMQKLLRRVMWRRVVRSCESPGHPQGHLEENWHIWGILEEVWRKRNMYKCISL